MNASETTTEMSSPQAPPAGGDRDMGSTINAVNWTFTMVALAAVCARLFGRIKLSRNLGWDDFWIMVSMVRPSVLAASVCLEKADRSTISAFKHSIHRNGYSKYQRRHRTPHILYERSSTGQGYQAQHNCIRARDTIGWGTKACSRMSLGEAAQSVEDEEMAG